MLAVRTLEADMATSFGDPTNYLSLALDARKVANALRQFSKTGVKSRELVESLRDTVDSLNALQSGEALSSRLHSTYEYYEQIRTLKEVQQSMKERELIQKLASIVSGRKTEAQKRAGIAVRFFTRLENRAMQRYNHASALSR